VTSRRVCGEGGSRSSRAATVTFASVAIYAPSLRFPEFFIGFSLAERAGPAHPFAEAQLLDQCLADQLWQFPFAA